VSNSGLVYILTNPSFRDDLLKIGMTTRTAEARAWEIYLGATGVPEPFQVAYAEVCSDCALAERRAHDRLQQHRVNANREFFNLALSSAIQVIHDEVLAINAADPPKPALTHMSTVVLTQRNASGTESPSLESPGVEARTTIRFDPTTGAPQVSKDQGVPVFSELPIPRHLPWMSIFLGACAVGNLFAAYDVSSRNTTAAVVFLVLGLALVVAAYVNRGE
jgi:hypothetical protein